MNHRPIEGTEFTTAQLRVREPLVTREEPVAVAEPETSIPQNESRITRAVRAFTRRLME